MATAPVINIPKDTPPEMAQNMMGIVKSIRDISFKSQKVSVYQVDAVSVFTCVQAWADVTGLKLNISLKKPGFIVALFGADCYNSAAAYNAHCRLAINGSAVASSVRLSAHPQAYHGTLSTQHSFRAGAGPIEVKVQSSSDANQYEMNERSLILLVVEDA